MAPKRKKVITDDKAKRTAGAGSASRAAGNVRNGANVRSGAASRSASERHTGGAGEKDNANDKKTVLSDEIMEIYVRRELKKRERIRKGIIIACALFALGSLGYVFVYAYETKRTTATYEQWNNLKDYAPANLPTATPVVIHYTDGTERTAPPVLEEYSAMLNKNSRLIGWLSIPDTKIDFPVMQTTDNQYYLTHNLEQKEDRNGSIFMDKDCDVLKPSTNFILYGHHMKSGAMFGTLDKYESEEYYKSHPVINFDTIYEHGSYQVMYAFRSAIRNEADVSFKYYQFIDALSDVEFDSNMAEMAKVALYDTGVTARYGDHLLTLSTCDYQETNGRFVVVAKRIK